MNLSALAGNVRLKARLSGQGGGRGLAHAYILSGPVGSGRHTLARILAAAALCGQAETPCMTCAHCKKVMAGIHPDVIFISGDGEKPVSVDQVRQMRTDTYIRPNEGARKVYVLEKADRMNGSAQNALLKLLEEGPGYAMFLLLAERCGELLNTVRSRCQQLELAPLTAVECLEELRRRFPQGGEEELTAAALACQGILGRAMEQMEGGAQEREILSQRVRQLARLMVGENELALFQGTMELEKEKKETLLPLLDALVVQLGDEAAHTASPKRALRGVRLVQTVRAAAQFNANSGQLAGWLCAGMFP